MALFVKTVALLVLMAKFQVSLGVMYKVGDSAGWTTIGNVNYKQWAATKTFQVGDIIRKFLSDNGNFSGFWVMISLVVYLSIRIFQVASFFVTKFQFCFPTVYSLCCFSNRFSHSCNNSHMGMVFGLCCSIRGLHE